MRHGHRAKLSVLLVTVALAMAAVGCGGKANSAEGDHRTSAATQSTAAVHSESTSTSTEAAGSRFIAQAESVCARLNVEIAALEPKSHSDKEVERVAPRHIELERAAIAALEKLTPPQPLAHSWAQMLRARRVLAEELAELLSAAKRRDAARIAKLASSKRLAHLALASSARGSGFTQCGRIGAASS